MNIARNVTRARVLRALSRFDSASCPDLASALGVGRGSVWDIVCGALADGAVERIGRATYRITDKGSAELRSAA